MSRIRTHISLRALPVYAVAGVVHAFAQGGPECFNPPTPRFNTASSRRHFDGIAVQN